MGSSQIPQLSFDLKYSLESLDFSDKLLDYISKNYQENPQNFTNDIIELNELRESVINVSKDLMGCGLLKKYLSYLQYLANKFPMKENEKCACEFSWNHLFDESEIVISDIRYEQICIFYNIGALHCFLGVSNNRINDEAIKISCTHFQYSAWCFQTINNSFINNFNVLSDINSDFLSFLMNISLAQAQECVFEKSLKDNRKNTIIAKISSQIEKFFDLAMNSIEALEVKNVVGSRKIKEWKQYVLLKKYYYRAYSFYYWSLNIQEQGKYALSIAYLQSAKSKLEECYKYKPSQEYMIIFKSLQANIETKLSAFEKENDFIYHEKVPSKDSLAEVESVSVVKCLPIDFNEFSSSVENKFSSLIPIEVHEISSLYSEEKAKLLRAIVATVEQKDKKLQDFLDALNIDTSFIDKENELVPKQLLESFAAFSTRPNILSEIPKLMGDLVEASIDVKTILDDIGFLLNNKDKVIDLKNKHDLLIRKFQEAQDSNSSLHSACSSTLENLKILSLPLKELEKKLPSTNSIQDENFKIAKDKLMSLLDKVQEMKVQRIQLLQQLRKSMNEDEIGKKLIQSNSKNHDDLFKIELKKYDQISEYIEQNLIAQDNILRALGDSNAAYTEKYVPIKKEIDERKNFVNGLVTSFNNVDNIVKKCQQGIECFEKLTKNCKDLYETVLLKIDNTTSKPYSSDYFSETDRKVNYQSEYNSQNTFSNKDKYQNVMYNIPKDEDLQTINSLYINSKFEWKNNYEKQNINAPFIPENRTIQRNNVNQITNQESEILNYSKNYPAHNFTGAAIQQDVSEGILFKKPSNNFKKESIYETKANNASYENNSMNYKNNASASVLSANNNIYQPLVNNSQYNQAILVSNNLDSGMNYNQAYNNKFQPQQPNFNDFYGNIQPKNQLQFPYYNQSMNNSNMPNIQIESAHTPRPNQPAEVKNSNMGLSNQMPKFENYSNGLGYSATSIEPNSVYKPGFYNKLP